MNHQFQLFESHSHTTLCQHATGSIGEYAAVANAVGLAGLIVTCHNPMPNGFASHVRMAESEFDVYTDLVENARQDWEDRLEIRLGLEADFFPGMETYLEQQIASAPFHYVLGSVHPQLKEYKAAFWNGDAEAFQRQYFCHLADAAKTGLFDCLSHPDLVKNVTAEHWQPTRILSEIEAALDRIAETGIAMELNTSGLNKRIEEMNPFPAMLERMRERNIPVVLGADAHEPGRVGDHYVEALELLDYCGFQTVSVFENRQRCEIDIAAARNHLVQSRRMVSQR